MSGAQIAHFLMIIPVRGYRESGGVETVDPALWKL